MVRISLFSLIPLLSELYGLTVQIFWYCNGKVVSAGPERLIDLSTTLLRMSGIWIYAAAWEFNQNLNAAVARALMQSGLRACPTSEDLWVEYLRMELTYLNKLKARKVILGEDKGTLNRDHGEWLARLNSKRTGDKDEEIKSSWLDKAIQIYEEAIKVEPSATMFTLYMRFLRDVIGHRSGETQSSGLFSNSDTTVDPISHALMVYERAESLDCITEDLACQHISLFIELGRLE
ncbi:hypothetical protein Vadar_003994 [Vaccinium darrowii]|uniref:Uncharacterized protein n=1 Tax=Vaccinium darrowii TaxID=229202 RepID=A0ACB7XFL7_9ERIC|nr:hypothetical protein Vadar_003994 [Vaccinium darrowii]